MVKNEVAFVKQKEHAFQWYTLLNLIPLEISSNNSRNNMVSKMFQTFCADFITYICTLTNDLNLESVDNVYKSTGEVISRVQTDDFLMTFLLVSCHTRRPEGDSRPFHYAPQQSAL